MTKRFYLLIICLIICYPTWSNASKDIDGARKFINEFILSEFRGVPSFRVDNALYSKERELYIKKKYIQNRHMVGEILLWDCDKLCVVDGFEIISIKIENSKAIVDVAFQEYACRESKDCYYSIPLIKTNKKNVEKYILEYKKGRWWIHDPPIPRISRKAMIDYNNDQIKDMSKWIYEKGVKKQKEYYQNIINTNDMLKGN